MKIIDLLNKIATGEEVPKKIKWQGQIYEYSNFERYYYQNGFSMYRDFYTEGNCLNDEIEIIEEPKKIEKLPCYSLVKIQKSKSKDELDENRLKLLEKRINDYHNKINELIDEINNLKEK